MKQKNFFLTCLDYDSMRFCPYDDGVEHWCRVGVNRVAYRLRLTEIHLAGFGVLLKILVGCGRAGRNRCGSNMRGPPWGSFTATLRLQMQYYATQKYNTTTHKHILTCSNANTSKHTHTLSTQREQLVRRYKRQRRNQRRVHSE